MKILSIVGARPQFIKVAMVHKALSKRKGVKHLILHTGQHYDENMSDIFFRELELPRPHIQHHLSKIAAGLHGAQTAEMLVGIEQALQAQRPDWVIVYGDTNSTLAGALAAAKLHIPVAHVEAGLRSFNRRMPEEINRILTDRLSTLLFVPTPEARQHLSKEGIRQGVQVVGDVMIDAILYFSKKAARRALPRAFPKGPFFLLTLHRQENTDHPTRLAQIMKGLAASPYPIVFPVHPRTRKFLKSRNVPLPKQLHCIDPVGYLDMLAIVAKAEAVWTDSGGLQKESVVLGKPCYTLRDETEWTETVRHGWNVLLGAETKKILRVMHSRDWEKKRKSFPTKRYYGDGGAALKIAKAFL